MTDTRKRPSFGTGFENRTGTTDHRTFTSWYDTRNRVRGHR